MGFDQWNLTPICLFPSKAISFWNLDCDPFDSTVSLIKSSNRILVVVGAGISVAAGIPDFRSPDSGLYSKIKAEYPELPCPEAIFDIDFFRSNPQPFYSLCHHIFLKHRGTATTAHKFIKELENRNKLYSCLTQNIDTLESQVDLKNVVYCHGSFLTSKCLACQHPYTIQEFTEFLSSDSLQCAHCSQENNWIKPNVVFFGEPLPSTFHSTISRLNSDHPPPDLLIVMGSSLKVHPVASIPDYLPPTIPQILINLEPITDHNFDLTLLGDCQSITGRILNEFSK